MKRGLVPLVVAAIAVLAVPAAEAKFRLTVTVEPARPIVRTAARVVARTDVDLPQEHRMRMFAVGPWRPNFGQAFFEIRLARTGPRTFVGRVRFPHAGRWRLSVPTPGAPHPLDRWVSVRPRA